jgi:hypothetical protein
MVLALGVMIEEATDNSWSHSLVYSECRHIQPLDDPINDHINDPEDLPDEHEYHIASFQERKKTCDMLLKADKWYYVMLFTSDIVLVISIIALFAMFAQWMVFTALVSNGSLVITEFSLMEIPPPIYCPPPLQPLLSPNWPSPPTVPPPTNYPSHPNPSSNQLPFPPHHSSHQLHPPHNPSSHQLPAMPYNPSSHQIL